MMNLFKRCSAFIVCILTQFLAYILHPVKTYRLTCKCISEVDDNAGDPTAYRMISVKYMIGIANLIKHGTVEE